MIIGYSLSGPDNDSYLKPDLWGRNICECLDYVRNREKFIDSEFKIKKSKFDFSLTYDGATIVSDKFRLFCQDSKIEGIEFHQLVEQKNLFLLKVYKTLEFDSEKRKTKFLEYNEKCSEYNEVVGATPVCLKSSKELKSGFYRTDIEFARGYAKSPILIIGTGTYNKIRERKFSGLHYEKILDKYDWEDNTKHNNVYKK